MRPIAIVKLGSTFPKLNHALGDFEAWIENGLKLPKGKILHCSPLDGGRLPECSSVSGIILSGSHDMVTDELHWSLRISEWLLGPIEKSIPIFGICYGHQLLAHILGGKVGNNEKGPEFGSCHVQLTEEARKDELFSDLSSPLLAHCCHQQSVIKLPKEAKLLATNDSCTIQAFRSSSCWGVQFHPEFSAAATREYVLQFKEKLESSGLPIGKILAGIKETPESHSLLKRFTLLCDEF